MTVLLVLLVLLCRPRAEAAFAFQVGTGSAKAGLRVLVVPLGRTLALARARKGVSHRRPRALAAHASVEGLGEVVRRRDGRAHLGHGVIRGSYARGPGLRKVNGRSQRRRWEAGRVGGGAAVRGR